MSDGTVGMPENRIGTQEIKLIKRSRKQHTCVLGCAVLRGSSYLRINFMEMTGSCDGGNRYSLAVCEDHIDMLRNKYADVDPDDLTDSQIFDALA